MQQVRLLNLSQTTVPPASEASVQCKQPAGLPCTAAGYLATPHPADAAEGLTWRELRGKDRLGW